MKEEGTNISPNRLNVNNSLEGFPFYDMQGAL